MQSLSKIFYSFFEKAIDKSSEVCYNVRVASKRHSAGVAELADARDLKSRVTRVTYRFDPGHRHHTKFYISRGRAVGSSSGS